MLRLSTKRQGGGLLEAVVPGYKDKIWNSYDAAMKKRIIAKNNDAYEKGIMQHKQWGGVLASYKQTEEGMKPSHKYRKPAVDWRRQEMRGTILLLILLFI